jgi:hypothetical protein
MSEEEQHIPPASGAVMGFFGRNESGYFRSKCVTCNDKAPLTDTSRIWGDRWHDHGDACDVCGVSFFTLSVQCQAEHDAQQRRFASQANTMLNEYGIVSRALCRIF